jgi:hypothetical protein
MLNSLIIGSTSQLSYYFPLEYERISSRNIDYNKILNKKYESIYLLFSEQRTFLGEDLDFFKKINYDYTIEVIDKLKNIKDQLLKMKDSL